MKDGDELVDRRDGFRRFIIAGKRGSFAARGFGPLVDKLLVPGLEVRKALGVDDHRVRVGGDGGRWNFWTLAHCQTRNTVTLAHCLDGA